MVAVVLLDNGRFPPKWRDDACLMAGVCPDPANSPDTIGVPVNPGGGLTPVRRAKTRSGKRHPEERCPLGPAGLVSYGDRGGGGGSAGGGGGSAGVAGQNVSGQYVSLYILSRA